MTNNYKPFSPDSEVEIQRLENALEAAGIGTWEYIAATNELRIGERFQNAVGLHADIIPLQQLLDVIAYQDMARVEQEFMIATLTGSSGNFDCEFRKRTTTGEAVWLRWKGQARFDQSGRLVQFSGALLDISATKSTDQMLKLVVEQAPVATAVYLGRELVIQIANDTMLSYWGKDRSVIGRPLAKAVPELEGQPFLEILDEIYQSGTTREFFSTPAKLALNGKLGTYYFDFTYKPLRDSAGNVFAIMNMAVDVTSRVLATRALETSEANLRAVISAAPAAIGLLVGQQMIVHMPNQAFIDIVDKGSEITGRPLSELITGPTSEPLLKTLKSVFTTGQMYQGFGVHLEMEMDGAQSDHFFDVSFTPLLNDSGQVDAILCIAIEVTEKFQQQQQIEKSQLELLSLFQDSPVGIAILSANDLVFTMANPFYGELVGRTPNELIGKPLLDALPEIEGQGFVELLNEVVHTGTAYIRKEVSVNLVRNGKFETIYVDLSYLPRRAKDNTIYGILVAATDVTQQVNSRSIIEQAESDLRGAIELADLATWRYEPETNLVHCSDRLLDWLGASQVEISLEDLIQAVQIGSQQDLRIKIDQTLSDGVDATMQIEFTLQQTPARKPRILALQGSVHKSGEGSLFLHGIAQNITIQRQYEASLEELVQLRTNQLEAAGEEMAATNEELMQANQQLLRSNDSLQQFSYVASHDLQEPLRKIQSFGDMLESKYGHKLGDGNFYLRRMQNSAKRMSALIEDLLSFSRASYQELVKQPVDLNQLIGLVLSDLELPIADAKAQVSYENLPVIEGDQSQLVQLFTNLISNAIKFRREGVPPLITVVAHKHNLETISLLIRPVTNWVRIDVTDNGIGFDPVYADRIFQVFQRLHGKSEFQGTGIGLAICEKVVTNHGGTITAASTPGAGSTFTICFPVRFQGYWDVNTSSNTQG